MGDALIGYTGFVGSNLSGQRTFEYNFNSKNSTELENRIFNTVICAGISAIKWKANQEPEKDKQNIDILKTSLSTIKAEKFILISTIDVYPVLSGADENYDCHSQSNHAYGTHRLGFEEYCKKQFPDCLIVRLPGLFGKGLKKNIIFDLINDNCLDMINPDSSFQYYNLDNLWSDIQIAIKNNLSVVNFVTEPVFTSHILDKFFPDKQVGQNKNAEIHYDLHTMYGKHWGNKNDYIYSHDEIIFQLSSYLENHI